MERKRAFTVSPDGHLTNVQPKNGTDFSLEELQKFVGGNIEIIRFGNDELMVLKDEGKFEGLPYNAYATVIAHDIGAISWSDFIVGTALICHCSMIT